MEAEYKIIGGDGTEYGPASLAELKDWIIAGRVANATQVWRSDSTSWLPAGQYAELQPDLARLYENTAKARLQSLVSAGFWARLAAYMLDQFLLCFVVAILWSFLPEAQHLKFTMPAQINTEAEFRALLMQIQDLGFHMAFIYYPVFLIYEVWFTGRFGATLGKMAIQVRIIRVNGMPINYQTAFLRWLAARLSQALFFIGYLTMIFQPQKRAMHDLLAGTRVVFKR